MERNRPREVGHAIIICLSDFRRLRSLSGMSDNNQPRVPVPDYRPVERFWPYVDLPEQPTDEELAALDPELSEALFGTPKLPFSVTLEFPVFAGPDYARALAMARALRRLSRRSAPAPRCAIARASIRRTPSRCATSSPSSAASTRPTC